MKKEMKFEITGYIKAEDRDKAMNAIINRLDKASWHKCEDMEIYIEEKIDKRISMVAKQRI